MVSSSHVELGEGGGGSLSCWRFLLSTPLGVVTWYDFGVTSMSTVPSVWFWAIHTRSLVKSDPVSMVCGTGQKCASAASSPLSLCEHVSHSLASLTAAALVPQVLWCAICDTLAVLLDCTHSSMVLICMTRE